MAVRWYLPPSGGSPGITPTQAAEWDSFAAFTRVVPSLTKTNTAFANAAVTDATATANRDTLIRQFIYPLPVGTVFASSGQTWKGRVLALEGAAASNLRSQAIIRVIASNGSTVQATLYGGDLTTGTANPTSEWNTAARNAQMPRGTTVANAAAYTSVAGDYLVIEIGYRKHAAASTTGTIRLGDTNASSDLPENETQTTDGATWIEWSGSLPVTHQGSGTGAMALSGSAAARLRLAASGSGAMALSGSADATTRRAPILASASGASTLSGSADATVRRRMTASGSIALSGSAAPTLRTRVSGSGAGSLSGSAATRVRIRGSGSAAMLLLGAATPRLRVRASGSAFIESNFIAVPTSAGPTTHQATASGAASLSGSANVTVRRRVAGSGAMALAGSAAGRIRLAASGWGEATLWGDATPTLRVRIRGSAEIALTGSAVAVEPGPTEAPPTMFSGQALPMPTGGTAHAGFPSGGKATSLPTGGTALPLDTGG